jgi:hypothetical protein
MDARELAQQVSRMALHLQAALEKVPVTYPWDV